MGPQRTSGSHLPAAPLAAVLLLWLSGLATAAPVITQNDVTSLYSPDNVMTAKKSGGLPAEIFGGPSARATPSGIAARLRLPATVDGGRVLPVGRGGRPARMRLVLFFNTDDVNTNTACTTPGRIGARKLDGKLNVFAVLCDGASYVSQAHLRDDSVRGETAPGYANAMDQLFLALMPPEDQLRPGRN